MTDRAGASKLRPVLTKAAVPEPSAPRLAAGIMAACAAMILLRALAAATTTNWLWGVNTLRYWGLWGAAAVALFASLGLLPPVARAIETLLGRWGRAWAGRPVVGDVLAASVVAAITWGMRDGVQFTGDFALRVGSLSTSLDLGKLFPQAFPLDALLHLRFARLLVEQGVSAENTLQGIGAVMAFAFTLGAVRFARGLGCRDAALPATVLVLVAGGWMPHFAGYEKYGPLLVGLVFAASGLVRFAAGRGGEWELALGTIACAATHRAGLAVVPASVLAFALAWRAAPVTRRPMVMLAGLVTLGGIAALMPLAWHVLTTVDRSVHLPGGEVARTFETRGEADALVRVADTLNGLFFLVPLWPVGLVAGWLGRGGRGQPPAADEYPRRIAAERQSHAGSERRPRLVLMLPIAMAIACQLALLLVIRATRGGGRDWDASTVPALTVALAATGALAVAWARAGRAGAIAPVVTLALACGATSWALHANPVMNLTRIQTQLDARPAWSAASLSFAHDQIGVYLLAHAAPDAAARHFETAFAQAPNPRYAYQAGLAHYDAGHRDAAAAAFRTVIARNPHVADPWGGLARIALDEGDTLLAAALADSALRRNRNHAVAVGIRGEIVRARRRP